MRQLEFDLMRQLEGDRQGSHGTRRMRRRRCTGSATAVCAPEGWRAGMWQRQGLGTGTMRNRMAHLRWWAERVGKAGVVRGDNASYGIGTGAG